MCGRSPSTWGAPEHADRIDAETVTALSDKPEDAPDLRTEQERQVSLAERASSRGLYLGSATAIAGVAEILAAAVADGRRRWLAWPGGGADLDRSDSGGPDLNRGSLWQQTQVGGASAQGRGVAGADVATESARGPLSWKATKVPPTMGDGDGEPGEPERAVCAVGCPVEERAAEAARKFDSTWRVDRGVRDRCALPDSDDSQSYPHMTVRTARFGPLSRSLGPGTGAPHQRSACTA